MEEKNTNATKRRNPVTWVPSVYFAMGLPFVVLNMVTVLMFKGLDISMPRLRYGPRLSCYLGP